MKEIKIKCPTCGKVLRLADAPNVNQAAFTCPVCKEKHKVGDCQRLMDAPASNLSSEETQYMGSGRAAGNADETQIYFAPRQQPVGSLVDSMGKSYPLCHGINTVGRKATTSSATIQIDTADRYMSRSHAIIEVRQAGNQTVHILKNGGNKNPSYLNGTLIAAADQLILNNGDRIKLGYTELTFKL